VQHDYICLHTSFVVFHCLRYSPHYAGEKLKPAGSLLEQTCPACIRLPFQAFHILTFTLSFHAAGEKLKPGDALLEQYRAACVHSR
jgi:hypothetical protein